MSLSFILLDDIGSVVNLAVILSLAIASVPGFFIFRLPKEKEAWRVIAAIVTGAIIFCLAMWAIINLAGYLAG